VAQDYKRALDGDRGPNTGGMGTYSPVEWLSPDEVTAAEEAAVAPLLRKLAERGVPFRGVLFTGFMVQANQPYVLEYNVRFGDPEIQSVVRRLGGGFAEALRAVAAGEEIPEIEVKKNAAVSVVLASAGYPGKYTKGHEVTIGEMGEHAQVFHAGTAFKDGKLVTSGGRVVAVTAEADTLGIARHLAYEAAKKVEFEGKQFRTDIATG
jgi:phosphoribosylamine--glycine ligase